MKGTEIQRIESAADETIASSISQISAEQALQDLCFEMGGLDAIQAIANNLNSALIVRLQKVRDSKGYRAAGFDRFEDFMDEFPRSPMSYKRFNYVENIFKSLGADVFDLTSSAGLSMRQMKMLGKGNVEVEGDVVKVQTDDGELEVPITNRRQWLEAVKTLADANADKTLKLEKQKEKIAKHDDEKRDIYAELDRVKAEKAAEIGKDPHSIALANVCFAFAALRDEAGRLTDLEREARRANVLEILAGQMTLTADAYGGGDWTRSAAGTVPAGNKTAAIRKDATDAEFIDALLDGVDLSGDDNDAELAASM